jgi:hypothetical protein
LLKLPAVSVATTKAVAISTAATTRTRGRAIQSNCSRVITRPATKNGSSPKVRGRSSAATVLSPPTRQTATATAIATPGRSRVSSGVASRQRNSTVRYHSGQCGLM